MVNEKKFAVSQLAELKWPSTLQLPSRRFRLFVAADVSALPTETISDFASAALGAGMIYFCSWGRDCERFHDIVDEVIVGDRIGDRRFTGPLPGDTVMTTWHKDESLEEALDFFATFAVPTDGFAPDSDFRLIICVNNADWANAASRHLQLAKYFV
jgi:hypothetical protein